jgi:transposase
MLHLEEWMDIHLLAQQGHSVRAIARLTGRSRHTVRRILTQKAPQPFRRPARPSKLDPFKPYLDGRFQEYGLSAVRLLEGVRPMGYTGSIDVVRRYLATLKPTRAALAKATVRFETPPGHQGQIDWMHCGRFLDAAGETVAVYAFTMVLGFSRALFVEFTPSMDLPTLLRCHQSAFEFFGGWPRELLYDNMAQVRSPGTPTREAGGWNPLFLDFAHHYGFVPRTHRVRRPRTKGKVERMVGYVADNFLRGRSFIDLADLNLQGRHWLTHTANVRLHATTGCRPCDLLAQEGLTPLSSARLYPLRQVCLRKVDAEGFVHLCRSRYSAPPERVGQTLIVEEAGQQVILRAGDVVVAEHRASAIPGACVVQREHVEALWQLTLGDARAPAAGARPPAPPPWRLTFQDGVAVTPLAAYEAVAGVSGGLP